MYRQITQQRDIVQFLDAGLYNEFALPLRLTRIYNSTLIYSTIIVARLWCTVHKNPLNRFPVPCMPSRLSEGFR